LMWICYRPRLSQWASKTLFLHIQQETAFFYKQFLQLYRDQTT
jgi:hypothetical protein